MVLACIDIGSNTTRLLVAETAGGTLRALHGERAFTRLGRSAPIVPAEKVREAALVVAAQAATARELGAREVTVVATAAVRDAQNRVELLEAIERALGAPARVLSAAEEARLSFAGATRTLPEAPSGTVAVVDVGGGSTEVSAGRCGEDPRWSRSFAIGSGTLAGAHLRSDPPTPAELDAVRETIAGALTDLDPPPAETALAVGGTATSLARLAGGTLDAAHLDGALRAVCSAPAAQAAESLGLDPERVRLMPAGMLVLQAVSARLGGPLRIARGGLREGAILELSRG